MLMISGYLNDKDIFEKKNSYFSIKHLKGSNRKKEHTCFESVDKDEILEPRKTSLK